MPTVTHPLSMTTLYRIAGQLVRPLVVGLALTVVACSSGSSSSGSTTAPPEPAPPAQIAVSGMAVKGPLAFADVAVYTVDTAVQDWRGERVATGTTDEFANFTGVMLEQPVAGHYIVDVTANNGTLDLNTGTAPVMQRLSLLASGADIRQGHRLYATSLTTLACSLAALTGVADASADAAYADALQRVADVLGFGLLSAPDAFTAAPVYPGEAVADARERLAHRMAIEAVSTIVYRLQAQTGFDADRVIEALAQDMADGTLDGLDKQGAAVVGFLAIDNASHWFESLPVAHLPIPNTQRDGQRFPSDPYTIADVHQLMVWERAALGIDLPTPLPVPAALKPVPIGFDLDRDGWPDRSDFDDDGDGILDVFDDFTNLASIQATAADTVFDKQRRHLYLSAKDDRKVYAFDVTSGELVSEWQFAYMPEHMYLQASRNELYIALLAREHSSYWWDDEQYGYIAVIDLATGELARTLEIRIDPYDLVVTAAGKLVVSSGSGQWADILAVDAASGAELGAARIRQQSRLALHPNERWVYTAGTESSLGDIGKFDLSGDGITALYNSLSQGVHRVSGGLTISEDGAYLVTHGGDVFQLSSQRSEDMLHVTSLTAGAVAAAHFDAENNLLFTVETDIHSTTFIRHYNASSLLLIGERITSAAVSALYGYYDELLIVQDNNGNGVEIGRTDHPCPDCGNNTAPIAYFTVNPATGGDTTTTYTFDASASTDAESALRFRWDWESDGSYDTELSAEPAISRDFDLAGSKYITLQAVDTAGLYTTYRLQLDVAQGFDDEFAFELPFEVTAAEYDEGRGKLYATDRQNRRLYIVDLASGLVETHFEFAHMPERMAVTPDGRRLYVALATRDHSAYWWEEDQNGFIAVFDLEKGEKLSEFEIAIDPYDLVATDAGKLVVTSGSGQWTYIIAYDVASQSELGKARTYDGSVLSLHPNQQWVYAANRGLTPSDIEKFDISGEGIVELYDSPYHGDHRMSGGVWVTPDGDRLITRGGDVFAATGDVATDMTYLQGLSAGIVNGLHFDITTNLVFTLEKSVGIAVLNYYNLSTMEFVDQVELDSDPAFTFTTGDSVFTLASGNSSTLVYFVPHPCIECGLNTAPIAAFSVNPDVQVSTQDDITFSAAASSDAESELLYRWDWDADGVYDTPYSDQYTVIKNYPLGGTKTVFLQVKDTGGLTHRVSQTFDVSFVSDANQPATGGAALELQFRPDALVYDHSHGRILATDANSRRLYAVDAGTGIIQRRFEFDATPARMTITPDGNTLYLALEAHPQDCCRDDDQQRGYIVEIDLASMTRTNQFEVSIDPYDLVVTSDGKLVISSASGQWTTMRAYDVSDGSLLGSVPIRHRSNIALSADERSVFAVDTDTSSSDIEKFDISGRGIVKQRAGGSGVDSKVWSSPDGEYLVSSGGDVFSSSTDAQSDFLLQAELTEARIRAVAFDVDQNLLLTIEVSGNYFSPDYHLRYYDAGTFARVDEQPLTAGDLLYLHNGDAHAVSYSDHSATIAIFTK